MRHKQPFEYTPRNSQDIAIRNARVYIRQKAEIQEQRVIFNVGLAVVIVLLTALCTPNN